MPGNDSSLIWTEYVPFDSLPQVRNPSSGFVQNSNSSPFRASLDGDNPDPSQFPSSFGIETKETDRSLRIHELLTADESITHQEFLKYKWDQTVTTQGRMWKRIQPILRFRTGRQKSANSGMGRSTPAGRQDRVSAAATADRARVRSLMDRLLCAPGNGTALARSGRGRGPAPAR